MKQLIRQIWTYVSPPSLPLQQPMKFTNNNNNNNNNDDDDDDDDD